MEGGDQELRYPGCPGEAFIITRRERAVVTGKTLDVSRHRYLGGSGGRQDRGSR